MTNKIRIPDKTWFDLRKQRRFEIFLRGLLNTSGKASTVSKRWVRVILIPADNTTTPSGTCGLGGHRSQKDRCQIKSYQLRLKLLPSICRQLLVAIFLHNFFIYLNAQACFIGGFKIPVIRSESWFDGKRF